MSNENFTLETTIRLRYSEKDGRVFHNRPWKIGDYLEFVRGKDDIGKLPKNFKKLPVNKQLELAIAREESDCECNINIIYGS